ncbi:MAG: hypothetical protein AB7H71_15485, partial [Alphaproteobacteria bacterium]
GNSTRDASDHVQLRRALNKGRSMISSTRGMIDGLIGMAFIIRSSLPGIWRMSDGDRPAGIITAGAIEMETGDIRQWRT